MPHSPRPIGPGLLDDLPLPEHGPEASKADRGKLLVVAGSVGLPGGAILAALAALRVGCGTVRVAAPRSVAVAIGAAVPELMVIPLPETSDGTSSEAAFDLLAKQFKSCDAAVIGPGLGSGDEVDRLGVRFATECPLPTVVDAGSLLAWGHAGCPKGAGPRVFPPHAGEMARLTGLDPEEIDADRETIALRYAEEWGAVLIVKGRQTLIAGRGLFVNDAGTPGLGTAGSGDVLAGVIGGLLAQGADPTTAAAWGVHLHALAGEAAASGLGDDGMIASDVVARLPGAIRGLRASHTA